VLSLGRETPNRRAFSELGALQKRVRRLGARRNVALRRFSASRHGASCAVQGELWLEFTRAHAHYRCAVRRLAQFCLTGHGGGAAAAPAGPGAQTRP